MKNLLFIVLYTWSLLCRAEGLPDLGDASQEAMTPQQERKIGEQSMFEIRSDKDYLDDAEINDYLNQLGYQLVSNSNEPGQEFEFFALDDNSVMSWLLRMGGHDLVKRTIHHGSFTGFCREVVESGRAVHPSVKVVQKRVVRVKKG